MGANTTTYKRAGAYVTDPVLNETTGQFSANYTPGVSERRAGVSTYLHSGLKNADARTTDGSSVTADRQYDAFGNLTGGNGTWNGPFGYAGGYGYQEDGESGLKLLGHRYYDSTTGRFLSKDPIGDGRNWYSYCENNPFSGVDPTGLAVGHHLVPREVGWGKGGFSKEAIAVFDGAVTGPIPGGHNFGNGHSDYNKAVKEHFEEFCKKNKISPKNMTAQQARQFVDVVLSSKDPRIRGYLKKVYAKLGRKIPASFDELSEFAMKRLGRKLGTKALQGIVKKLPIIGWVWFGYDWATGGFGHARDEALWPASELWRQGG